MEVHPYAELKLGEPQQPPPPPKIEDKGTKPPDVSKSAPPVPKPIFAGPTKDVVKKGDNCRKSGAPLWSPAMALDLLPES